MKAAVTADDRFNEAGWPTTMSVLYIEWRFATENEWDNTIPGRMAVKWSAEFSRAEMSARVSQQFAVSDDRVEVTAAPWTYLLSPDGDLRCGIGRNGLHLGFSGAQLLRPWSEVGDLALALYQDYVAMAGVTDIFRIGMLSENTFSILVPDARELPLNDAFFIFPAIPPLGDGLPGAFGLWMEVHFVAPPMSQVKVSLELVDADVEEPKVHFQLNLDHSTTSFPESMPDKTPKAIREWLDVGFQRIRQVYGTTVKPSDQRSLTIVRS